MPHDISNCPAPFASRRSMVSISTLVAKAQKSAADTTIVETKLTSDGEEYYSYARSRQQDQQIQEQQRQQQQDQDQQEQQQDKTQQDTTTDKNARVPAVNVIWSPTLGVASLTVLSMAPTIARAVREVFEDGSVTSLFDEQA